MAKSKMHGEYRRAGAVKGTQRNEKTGRLADVKPDPKSTKVMERSAERFSDAMKRLAKR